MKFFVQQSVFSVLLSKTSNPKMTIVHCKKLKQFSLLQLSFVLWGLQACLTIWKLPLRKVTCFMSDVNPHMCLLHMCALNTINNLRCIAGTISWGTTTNVSLLLLLHPNISSLRNPNMACQENRKDESWRCTAYPSWIKARFPVIMSFFQL